MDCAWSAGINKHQTIAVFKHKKIYPEDNEVLQTYKHYRNVLTKLAKQEFCQKAITAGNNKIGNFNLFKDLSEIIVTQPDSIPEFFNEHYSKIGEKTSR